MALPSMIKSANNKTVPVKATTTPKISTPKALAPTTSMPKLVAPKPASVPVVPKNPNQGISAPKPLSSPAVQQNPSYSSNNALPTSASGGEDFSKYLKQGDTLQTTSNVPMTGAYSGSPAISSDNGKSINLANPGTQANPVVKEKEILYKPAEDDYGNQMNKRLEDWKNNAINGKIAQLKQAYLKNISDIDARLPQISQDAQELKRQNDLMEQQELEKIRAAAEQGGVYRGGQPILGQTQLSAARIKNIGDIELAQKQQENALENQKALLEQQQAQSEIEAQSGVDEAYLDKMIQAQKDIEAHNQDQFNKQLTTLGQYSNDYQAEINRRTAENPDDPMIPYLKLARQQKLKEQEDKNKQLKDAQYQNAYKVFQETGEVTPELAPILGLPVGTKSTDKINSETAQQKADYQTDKPYYKPVTASSSSSSTSTTQTKTNLNNYYNGFLAENQNTDGESLYKELEQNKDAYVDNMGPENYNKAIKGAQDRYYNTVINRWRYNVPELKDELKAKPDYYIKVLGQINYNKLMTL